MYIQQLYTGCLSEAAYYIESEGEAAIIDPLRDIEEYLYLARKRKATIKYIFETHFHADFVSGHLDLAQASGAPIVYGPETETNFPIYRAKDGEVFKLGSLSIEVLHTPGHTLESSCYLLREANGNPYAIFTGDTLFVGDVGRPDLSSGNLGREELASMLYDSLQKKIMPLPDHILIYPAHGAGSSCGKNLGPDTYSTLGEEKKTNYALRASSKEEFIKAVTEGLHAPPLYFAVNARINKEGYESLDEIMENGLKPLPLDIFKEKIKDDQTLVLDTRLSAEFTEGFVPGSVSIGLDGRFAEWAGSLLPFDKPFVLVTEPGKEKETVVRLARVGFAQIHGYLEGGFETWKNSGEPIDLIINIDADEFAMDLPFDPKLVVVDVRRETEFADGHVPAALNIPLETMTDPGTMAVFEDQDNIYIHCAAGYRSVIAASLFKRQGIHNLRNITGGWDEIKKLEGLEIMQDKSALN
ncbi:MAG TPA: MBL fold metallo-hydrolase [Chitinophagaceae bacterium]|jgi:hydroxyacylglutathione hydrolase|nr:MBL fold metallo-hydrolase [Chitinophagaceae bacterium]